MSRATRATKALEQAGVAFSVVAYEYDPNAAVIGLQAAQALGEDPARVFKTLMTLVDGRPACAIAPSDREISMKKLAAALGGKSAQMMAPAQAERMSGYRIGGVSPFGQTRRAPVVMDESALAWDYVYINAGQRGLQLRLNPRDAATALDATIAAL